MAKIIGTSDAWKSVCIELNRVNLKPERPADLHGFLESAKEQYDLAKTDATKIIKDKINALSINIEHLEKNFEVDAQRGKDEISASIETARLTLQLLQAGFIWKIINYFKIRKQKKKIQTLKKKYDSYPKQVQRKIDESKDIVEKMKRDFDVLVEKECRATFDKVMLLEKVIKSPEFAGGIAELELIENLRSLPDNCFVVSDVEIEISRAIHFDGDWLRSAQIDHIVVTPSGIFVIEVKNWSAKFVQEGDYFDPYQQVKRSTYLCYKLIGERYNLKARSIVAYKGSIPKKPAVSYAKVLPINEVRGYISWFKEVNASDQTVELIAKWLAN